MLINEFISDTLISMYPARKYTLLKEIYTSIATIDSGYDIERALTEYLSELPEYIDEADIRENVESIITKLVVENVVNNRCGILLSSNGNVDLVFLSGLLKLYRNLKIYNPIISPEISNILHSYELEPIEVIGELISLYEPDFYVLDAYDQLEAVPETTLIEYRQLVGESMLESATDTDSISELTTQLNNVNNELTGTKLFNHIITNSIYDISDKVALAFLDNVIISNKLADAEIAKELTVIAVLFNKSNNYITELVDSVYEEFNTSAIMSYIDSNMENVDGYYGVS